MILETLQDLMQRQWNDLLSRPSGPMAFRFVLQPAMAIFLALRDGFEDARTGREPYFWTILSDPRQPRGPANRIAHWWHHRYSHPHVPAPKK